MAACEECHRRKTRCDGGRPRCATCSRRRTGCSYPDKAHYRRQRQRQLHTLEHRLHEVERENLRLRRATTIADPSPATVTSTTHDSDIDAFVAYSPLQLADHDSIHVSGPLGRRSDPQWPTMLTPAATEPAVEALVSSPSARIAQAAAAIATTIPLSTPPGKENLPDTTSRYLGSSASVDFVGLVERVLGESDPPEDSSSSSIFARISDAYRKPEARDPMPHHTSLIPDRTVADHIVSVYFAHWHVTFPLLFRPSVLELVQRVYGEPDFYRQDPAGAFTFDMILALGSVGCKKFEWSFKDTESHFRRATSRLDTILAYRDIRSLQAYLLCCQYGIHASLRDTGEEMWELLGKAGRLCIELRLHQAAPSHRAVMYMEQHLTGGIPAAIQQEMARRCFWCFYSLERIVSVTLGRPLVPADDDIDVAFPSSREDEMLNTDSNENALRPNVRLKSHHSQGQCATPTTSPFLHLIQIRRILSKAHRFLYTSTTSRDLPAAEKQAHLKDIAEELDEWRAHIPELKLQDRPESLNSLSAFTFPRWYDALYHTTTLTLFRPSPTFPCGVQNASADDNILKITWEASRATIADYKEVLQARRLNYSWICLYTIFMAGLANIYSVARCAQRHRADPTAFLPHLVDVTGDIRDCSNILTAICERWDDARNSCEIFGRLSNCAVAELFKALRPGSPLVSAGPPARNLTTLADAAESRLPNVAPCDSSGSIYMGANALGADDFQNLFRTLQTDLYGNAFDGANEVILGLNNQWFEDVP